MEIDFLTDRRLETLRLAFDTGALVLIWLVQLVIYPVFARMEAAAFRGWHPVYTRRVTYVVMPIMLGQLALYAYPCLTPPTEWNVILNTGLVVAAWGITFFGAVPLHAALDGPGDHPPLSARLLKVNWYRTILWSLIWLVSVMVIIIE